MSDKLKMIALERQNFEIQLAYLAQQRELNALKDDKLRGLLQDANERYLAAEAEENAMKTEGEPESYEEGL